MGALPDSQILQSGPLAGPEHPQTIGVGSDVRPYHTPKVDTFCTTPARTREAHIGQHIRFNSPPQVTSWCTATLQQPRGTPKEDACEWQRRLRLRWRWQQSTVRSVKLPLDAVPPYSLDRLGGRSRATQTAAPQNNLLAVATGAKSRNPMLCSSSQRQSMPRSYAFHPVRRDATTPT